MDVKDDTLESLDRLQGPGIWKVVFVVGVTHDSSCARELTFDETLEFTVNSLEHVILAELIVRTILDFIWNS
jgi:hypothetical protein